jgi:hypothetical protein
MTYNDALLITAAFYAILTAGATWLCVFICDPLLPMRRDRKVRRSVVIGFALLCGAAGYGIANSEIVNGILTHYYMPLSCMPDAVGSCTPELQAIWQAQVDEQREAFWRWMVYPPLLRPHCSAVSETLCSISNGDYGTPNQWHGVSVTRGGVMAFVALLVGYLLTRPPKRVLTMEEEALASLPVTAHKRRTQTRRRL